MKYRNNETVSVKPYVEQIAQRGNSVKKKERRYSMIIQPDIARCHVANMNKHAIKELDLEVLPRPL